MSDEFILKLMFAQGVYGKPFFYVDGYRCAKYNKEIGGEEDSAHVYGVAAHIAYQRESDCFLMVKALIGAGIERVEIMSLESAIAAGKSEAVIHVDEHPRKPMPWLHVGRCKPLEV